MKQVANYECEIANATCSNMTPWHFHPWRIVKTICGKILSIIARNAICQEVRWDKDWAGYSVGILKISVGFLSTCRQIHAASRPLRDTSTAVHGGYISLSTLSKRMVRLESSGTWCPDLRQMFRRNLLHPSSVRNVVSYMDSPYHDSREDIIHFFRNIYNVYW